MPLFRNKQSSSGKRKFEHKIYLTKEQPDSAYDVSECELSEVPSGAYSLCKVLHKEALLLHNNFISCLKGGGNLVDLITIRILDLHDNELCLLPDDIHQLQNLQVLNVENNKLKKLPETIAKLENLQTLNVRKNKLKDLPLSVCGLKSLRNLDISENLISSLHADICYIRTLETISVDVEKMTCPPSEICRQGTEAMMRFLSSECGTQYIPPSKVLLNVLEVPAFVSNSQSSHSLKALQVETHLQDALMEQYESVRQQRHAEALDLERQIQHDQHQQAQLTTAANMQKLNVLNNIEKDQNKLDNDLHELQKRKESNRRDLVDSLYQAELDATSLTQRILLMNEKHRKREEILDLIEKDQLRAEQLFKVRQEEEALLRKQEVLLAMKKVITESEIIERIRLDYEMSSNAAAKRALVSQSEVDGAINDLLVCKDVDKSELVKSLMEEEELQRNAFIALQLEKDVKHQRVRSQIELIQQELSQLTLLEIDKRQQKSQTDQNILNEKRQVLSALLVQLMQERDKREIELTNRLNEMEKQRLDDQKDYWLIQYQRLMDKKPDALIDAESALEISVLKILDQSNAGEYKPHFARHRITIETMLQLTDDDLKQIGVHELGLRKSILQKISEYICKEKKEKDVDEDHKKEEDDERGATAETATAPPIGEPSDTSTVTARITTECVICMENESNVVFLMCGHVCCCNNCTPSIKDCPLCRAPIIQRVWLTAADYNQ